MTSPGALAAVALLVGAVAGAWLPVPAAGLRGVLVVVWGLAVASVVRRAAPTAVVVLLVAGFTLGGAALAAARRGAALETPLARWFDQQSGAAAGRVGPVLLEGRLEADAVATDFGAGLVLAVERVADLDRMRVAAGGVRLSVGGRRWASPLAEWRAGRRVRVYATLRRPAAYRNPGAADQSRRRALRGFPLVGSVKSALLVELVGHGSLPAEMAGWTRAAVRRVLDRAVGRYGDQSAAIVTAVIIGDRGGLDPETIRRLQEGGTYHVIAISGGNIAILAGCLLWLGRSAGLRPRRQSGAIILVLLAYAYLVGHEASVARATAAAVIGLSAGLLGHRTPPVNVLSIAAVAIGLLSPLAVLDPGFLLTFGATLGIVLGASRVAAALGRLLRGGEESLPRGVRLALTLLAATVCAEAVLLPIGAALFGRVSLAGLLLNFAAIPLMTVTQLAGLAALGLALLHPSLSAAAGLVAHLGATWLVESTRVLDVCPWLVFRVPPPAAPTVAVYYGALAASVWRGGSRRLRALGAIGVAVAAVWIMSAHARPALAGRPPAGWMRVTFLDVGQADATLIQTPAGRSVLVDAGGSIGGRSPVGARVVVPALWALGVRQLDIAAISHGDPDHIGGLPDVLRDLTPREIWEGVPVPGHDSLHALQRWAENAGSRWRRVTTPERLTLDGASISVLHPPPPDWERVRVRNDDSLVIDVRYGEVAVLLPGDIGRDVEGGVTEALEPVPYRVVKVPHHGSAGSSSRRFVEAARPCVAIVSAGRANPFGHPAPAVRQRYRGAGALVLETGREGAIILETDGQEVRLSTEAGRRVRHDAASSC